MKAYCDGDFDNGELWTLKMLPESSAPLTGRLQYFPDYFSFGHYSVYFQRSSGVNLARPSDTILGQASEHLPEQRQFDKFFKKRGACRGVSIRVSKVPVLALPSLFSGVFWAKFIKVLIVTLGPSACNN